MTLEITTRFATGNGVATSITDGGFVIDRDLRDSTGERWYWHVRLRASDDAAVSVTMTRPGLLGRFGPAVCTGGPYGRLSIADHDDGRFTLSVPGGRRTISVCATLPYGPIQLRRFRDMTSRVGARWACLATSEGGRHVPVMRLGNPTGTAVVLLTARHHACESTASYVLEGAVARFAEIHRGGDFRYVELVCVPVMDIDGMHAGDQGKDRQPWDHNRDYHTRSRYRSVRAMQDMINRDGRDLVGLDIHTPGLRGDIEEKPYVIASGDPGDVDRAATLLELVSPSRSELLVFDEKWNSATADGLRCCAAWLRSRPRTRMAHTIEYPNVADRGHPVTVARARAYGALLAESIVRVMN